MELRPKHHALLFSCIAKAAIDRLGDQGKEAVVRGVVAYGEQRGRRMARRAEADGVKIADPFMMDSTAARKFGDATAPIDNAKLYRDDFDWEDDKPINRPLMNLLFTKFILRVLRHQVLRE